MFCGHGTFGVHEVVDKAICLLHRGTDVNYRSPDTGDTLLHMIFKSVRLTQRTDRWNYPERVLLSVQAPLELLIAFIAAGANIFARNDQGRNPSEIAWAYGQEKEWHRALTVCGIDTEEFYDFTCRECHQCSECPDCSPKPPSSKLTFEDFCDRRQRGLLFSDLAISEDERNWLYGDYINVLSNPEWLDREHHNPHRACFMRYF